MIKGDFNYFQDALDRGYWFNDTCILALENWNKRDDKIEERWRNKDRTDAVVLVWNGKTKTLTEKSIYRSKNGYYITENKGYSSKSRVYIKDFKTKGGMIFPIDISNLI